ncbi:MAG: class I SAM-dependent methyltransferase [Verrucomicrobiota bacterium]
MTQFADVIDGHSFPREAARACPLCGQVRGPRTIPVRFGMNAMVAVCPDCRLAFQTPRPAPEASLAYLNWRWRSSDKYVGDPEAQHQRAFEQIAHVQRYVDRPPRLLDFGAGAGAFVRAALDQGWDAAGVEQCEAAMARAKEFHRVELRPELENERYDIVTMWDVIEHLRAPEEVLRMIGGHLPEGGLLFIETGNFESWRRVADGDRWHLYLFDHQFYFSPASLRRMLERAGFDGFVLLDTDRVRPPLNPLRMARHPVRACRAWRAWARAKSEWPEHGDMDIIVAVARKKNG